MARFYIQLVPRKTLIPQWMVFRYLIQLIASNIHSKWIERINSQLLLIIVIESWHINQMLNKWFSLWKLESKFLLSALNLKRNQFEGILFGSCKQLSAFNVDLGQTSLFFSGQFSSDRENRPPFFLASMRYFKNDSLLVTLIRHFIFSCQFDAPLVFVKIPTTMWAKNERSSIKNQYSDSFSLYLSLELDPLMLHSIIEELSSISNRNAMSQCSMQFEYFVLGMAFQIDLFHHKTHRISSIEKRKSALWCVSTVPVWNIIQTIPIDIEYTRLAGQKPRYVLHMHTQYH